MRNKNQNVYTVGQVNSYIKNIFDQDYMLRRIYVSGEVSNCKYHPSGHIYFSLKDAEGTISCVMFAGSRRGLAFPLRDGELRVAGIDASDPARVWELRRACGMVFQTPENQFVSSVVGEDVACGPLIFGAGEADARDAAALERVENGGGDAHGHTGCCGCGITHGLDILSRLLRSPRLSAVPPRRIQ